MKCTNCGRKIGVEDKVCPYCNSENKLAVQHAANMAQYDQRFKKTQGEVESSAKRMEGLGTRAVILAVLLIGILITSIVSGLNYADPDTDAIKEADAKKHGAEYAAEMDRYLEQGEYQDYVAFVHSHGVSFWDDAYQKFRSVDYCAGYYYECVRHMESVIFRSTDPDYWDSTDLNISHFCSYLCEFRDTYAVQKEREKNSVYLDCMDDMNQNVRAMLRSYLGMDDGEVDGFMDLSEAKMAVRMEEIIKHE